MNNPPLPTPPAQTTGKYLVLLEDNEIKAGVQAISNSTGIRDFAQSDDFEDNAISPGALADTDAIVLNDLGVAVVSLEPDQVRSLNQAVSSSAALITMEPERVVYALSELQPEPEQIVQIAPEIQLQAENLSISTDYLKGYRDAVNQLVDQLMGTVADLELPTEALPSQTKLDPNFTWGLQVTEVNTSPYSGLGIKVAVLDTGFDLTHPDFAGRSITSKSFIEGQEVQDGNGHGTHCVGTACGPKSPEKMPRYGVAYSAEIYAGKVLSDEGSGADGGILAGIDWAIANGCEVISMSLGAPVEAGQAYSKVYERVGRRALRRGTLIVAAAGNDSRRSKKFIAPVSHPANCPSILAVAAIDSNLRVAVFSNGGLNSKGGQIDVAAPGVDVYSAWPVNLPPGRYHTISGTSMATPHVAGLAALIAEANGAIGRDLWLELIFGTRRLSLSAQDIGSGLAQAVQEW
jgi:subtilisin family serine protease